MLVGIRVKSGCARASAQFLEAHNSWKHLPGAFESYIYACVIIDGVRKLLVGLDSGRQKTRKSVWK